MPEITHVVRAIFNYPFFFKILEKLPRNLSITKWISEKKY
jgi:hypothetical protein